MYRNSLLPLSTNRARQALFSYIIYSSSSLATVNEMDLAEKMGTD
jgi:hypothetical protein